MEGMSLTGRGGAEGLDHANRSRSARSLNSNDEFPPDSGSPRPLRRHGRIPQDVGAPTRLCTEDGTPAPSTEHACPRRQAVVGSVRPWQGAQAPRSFPRARPREDPERRPKPGRGRIRGRHCWQHNSLPFLSQAFLSPMAARLPDLVIPAPQRVCLARHPMSMALRRLASGFIPP